MAVAAAVSPFERARLQVVGRALTGPVDLDDLFRFASTEELLKLYIAHNQGSVPFFVQQH